MTKELKIKEIDGDVDHIDCERTTEEFFVAVTICANRCLYEKDCNVFAEYKSLSAPRVRARG